MRKRSGAIHCDSQEQFIRLSILSDKKLGIFYESAESPRPSVNIGFGEGAKLWDQFDYDKNQRAQLDQESIQSETIQTLNVMVLYDEGSGLSEALKQSVHRLSGCPNDPETQSVHRLSEEPSGGPLDLIIHEQPLHNRKLIVKFWISPNCSSPLIKSYLSRTDVFLNVHSPTTKGQDRAITKPSSVKQHFLSYSLELNPDHSSKQLDAFFQEKLALIRKLADSLHTSA